VQLHKNDTSRNEGNGSTPRNGGNDSTPSDDGLSEMVDIIATGYEASKVYGNTHIDYELINPHSIYVSIEAQKLYLNDRRIANDDWHVAVFAQAQSTNEGYCSINRVIKEGDVITVHGVLTTPPFLAVGSIEFTMVFGKDAAVVKDISVTPIGDELFADGENSID
jgi:hypothetical protein